MQSLPSITGTRAAVQDMRAGVYLSLVLSLAVYDARRNRVSIVRASSPPQSFARSSMNIHQPSSQTTLLSCLDGTEHITSLATAKPRHYYRTISLTLQRVFH